MKFSTSAIRNSLFTFALILALTDLPAAAQTTAPNASSTTQAQAPIVPARITQAIDETQLVTLKGTVHPLARPEFDKGAVSDAAPMKRMLLLLKRSVDQKSALSQLMVDQYNTNSPNYHKWMTPEQFGTQFGPADGDIQAVTSWLQGHGFKVAKVSKGKLAVEFSGTAAQVREAFHTEIHTFVVNGETHMANASEVQIPAALAPVVHGLSPLNNFRPKPTHRVLGEFTKSTSTSQPKSVNPEFTTSAGFFALGPTDFATIYNVAPLWTAGTDGTGQSIAVIGVSNINLQDVADFRTLFGLPTGGTNTPIVVIDGGSANDPGIVTGGSETEALLDVEWSGAVAKGAQIHFVIAADTDLQPGLILAILNVIDNNSDPILSLSFGDCEPNEGPNNTGFWEPVWEQAAAQGITVTVSTGDSGSAGCEDDTAPAPNPANTDTGLQVSGFASTPFNVAVGGTDFNDIGTQSTYFSATTDPTTLASALGYIPENTWNETCTNAIFNTVTGLTTPEANCNSTNAEAAASVVTLGGSGGASHCFTLTGTTCSGGYAKPPYQLFSGLTGMPADGTRDLPDVSLFASTGDFPSTSLQGSNSFYVVCEADAVTGTSCNKTGSFSFLAVGGTSASTPSFAGIMALVNQKNGRQGNANFVLYKLAQMQDTAGTACSSVASPLPNASCAFNDIPTGSTIATPCVKNSLNCNPTTGTDTIGVLSGYSTTTGYDLATGLGSVNANNLVTNWSKGVSAFTPTTVKLTLGPPTTGLTAGQSVAVNITVTPSAATGDVALVSNAATGDGVDGFTLGAGGTVSSSTTQLTGGTYQVTARYGGDGTFAPSVSAPVTVTVSNKAASMTAGSVLVSLGGGQFATFSNGAAPVNLILQARVSPTVVANNHALTPTGTVTFTDSLNGGTQATVASNVGMNQLGEAFTAAGTTVFGVGSHSVVATYNGDPSFATSVSPAVPFTITGTNTVPVVTTISPTSATAGGAGFTLTLNGSNFVLGATVKFGATAGLVPSSITGTQIMVTIPASAIASAGSPAVTVNNPAPGGGPSNSVAFTVNANTSTFTATGPANPVTIVAGSNANVAITLTPSGGFTSAGVTINCPTLPPGVHCPTTALSIPVPNANPAIGQLSVSVDAPAAANATASVVPAERKVYAAGLTIANGGKGWWTLSSITGFAAILLLLLPGRKRYRAALGLGMACALSFALGCGGGSGGGGGGGGPVTTTTHIMVTSPTKGPGGTAFTFTATVTGGTPTDMVQLFDGSTAIGTAVAVSGGAANLSTGAMSTVGTHAISAHYAGDATNTQASSSGSLNVTVTGPTTFSIAATPAASNGSPAINITIN
jgi:hypothetical protein